MPTKLRTAPEWCEQVELLRWVGLVCSREPRLELLFHIPNGEHRDPRTAAKLQRMGVQPGVPDLFLPVPVVKPGMAYHGCWIELKRLDGRRPSKKQLHWRGVLQLQAYDYHMARGWLDAAQHLCWYLCRADLCEELLA